MTERITILEHHRFTILQLFRGATTDAEIKKRAAQYVGKLGKMTDATGGPIYPGLQTNNNREIYAQIIFAQVKALRAGKAKYIPDFDQHGQPNFDGRCQFCGNKHENECIKPQK